MTKSVPGVLCGVALLAIMASSALAEGKHITCPFTGSISDGTHHTQVNRTMSFYLDDTHATLVGEGGDVAQGTSLTVHTKSYSDTWIDADISTGMPSDVFFFGQVMNGGAGIGINRVTGVAAYALKILPHGAETGVATCHEVAPPAAKSLSRKFLSPGNLL